MQGTPSASLRERISSELVRILRVYVLLITSLVMVAAVLTGHFYQRTQLGHQSGLALTKFSTELTNAGQQLESLASSSVLWTGLTDSVGREIYLAPLLERFNTGRHRKFLVLDYRGRVFFAADALEAEAIAADPAVTTALREGRDTVGMRTVGSGLPQVLLVQRVKSPLGDLPVGLIVASIDLMGLARQLQIDPGVRMAVSIANLPALPPRPEGILITSEATTLVAAGALDIPMSIWLGQSIYNTALGSLAAVLIALLLGLWTIRRVTRWAHGFSAATTWRLDQLVIDCRKILAGEAPRQIEHEPADELSQVTAALNTMLRQQKESTDALRMTSLVVSTAAEGILVTDLAGSIVDVNPALTAMTGYQRGELLGQQAGTLYRSVTDEDRSRAMAQALAQQGRWSGETSFLARSGQVIPTSVSISQIVGPEGAPVGNVAVITDVSRLKAAENRLRDLAYQDALTGLPNYRRMAESARALLESAGRTSRRFAILFMDLDQLKSVNDNYGHETGDAVIKGVGRYLRAALPPDGLLCRRSGDEFIAVVELEDSPAHAQVQRLVERLTPVEVATAAGSLSASVTIGVSLYPQDGTDWKSLEMSADVAMNEAKQAQRGSMAWFDAALGGRLYRRRQIQARLQAAIDGGAIVVHYQPEVDLDTGQVIGFEALARWTDPELGVVRPSEFIAVAEDAHLIEPLSLRVAETVMQDKPRLQARFPGAVVAMNVAPQVFRSKRLVTYLSDRAEDDPASLEGLEIELTESQIAASDTPVLLQLQVLIGIGAKLVIDDFGTGHSSLARLTQFPISRIKIDRSFVGGLHLARQERIARLIVNLAKVLDFEVTAEGVETISQREGLLAIGCRRGQGWLFAHALPLGDALALPATLRPLAQAMSPA